MLRFTLLAALAIASPASAQSPTWKAGTAKAVITPDTPVWLAGYGSKRVPDGKLHDLWMKALALEDHRGSRVVLVTSDNQGMPKVMTDRVFAELKAKHGLDRTQVMITFSHNHCGPRLGDDLIDYYPVEAEQEKLVEEYTRKMVGEALKNLAPATLAAGRGKATFAVNRRNNREADVPAILAKGEPLKGPVDHDVPVLTVANAAGKTTAILFGYACHPTTLSFTKWCGDYPGFAQLEIEKAHPGAMAMFVNTCGGDQNPLPRRTVELCEKYGTMLAAGVEDALKTKLEPIPPGLKTAFQFVDLPYEKIMTRADFETMIKEQTGIKKRWAERLLKKLNAGETFAPSYPYPIHAWRLGGKTLFIGMGAETVLDYAITFKAEYGRDTWVMGYADDMISYIPSKRVWLEGGYEGGSNLFEYGRPALRWSAEVEPLIVKTVSKLVAEVK